MARSTQVWEAGRTRLNSPDCHHDGYEDPQHHDHDRPKHDPGYVRVENFPKLHLLTSLLIRFVSQHERTRGAFRWFRCGIFGAGPERQLRAVARMERR